jgi:small subunit ribosomal protein S8
MAVTDPIADYLTRIRNAQQASHRVVEIPASNLKNRMTEILYEQGFIYKYKIFPEEGKQGIIRIALKYNPESKEPVIRKLGRMSKPGLRKFVKAKDLPRVINGLGIAMISTSHGIMTNKEATEKNLGGEVLCYVY